MFGDDIVSRLTHVFPEVYREVTNHVKFVISSREKRQESLDAYCSWFST